MSSLDYQPVITIWNSMLVVIAEDNVYFTKITFM